MRVDLPDGVACRLSNHYGREIQSWLAQAPAMVGSAAESWGLRLQTFHDAGWTSVVALAVGEGGRTALIKAVPDRDRYERERAALLHWRNAPVNRLLDFDDSEQLLLLAAVGGVRAVPHGRWSTNAWWPPR